MSLHSPFYKIPNFKQILYHVYSPRSTQRVFVSTVREVDNTLTLIIVSVLGGVIGLIILIMVVKAVVIAILNKAKEKK